MKKLILLLLILVVLFVSGCENNKETQKDTPYLGGANGLLVSFEPGAPVSEFTEEDSVDVKLKVVNLGEQEVPENSAKVKLYGVSQGEFNSLDFNYNTIKDNLLPIQKGISDIGSEVIMDMGKISYSGSIGGGYVERNLFAKVCYPYRTTANTEACITSKKTEELGSENICDYSGEKIKKGLVSSAPVQITSFNEELRGVSQVAFKIGFQNVGVGKVYDKETSCETLETSLGRMQNLNKIYVKLNPTTISCSFSGSQGSEGYLTLEPSQEKILTCILDVDQDSKYVQGVEITADYKYVDITSKNIKILGNQ